MIVPCTSIVSATHVLHQLGHHLVIPTHHSLVESLGVKSHHGTHLSNVTTFIHELLSGSWVPSLSEPSHSWRHHA